MFITAVMFGPNMTLSSGLTGLYSTTNIVLLCTRQADADGRWKGGKVPMLEATQDVYTGTAQSVLAVPQRRQGSGRVAKQVQHFLKLHISV